MRESDFCFPSQQRATITLTTTLYDRRALDSRAALPLLNSLTQLSLLTSTSSRMREILTQDGGLERLVQILHTKTPGAPGREGWIWMLAFHCLAHIGVRGTEQVRTRVVEAGGLGIVIRILAGWLAQKDQVVLDRLMGDAVRGVPMRRELRPRGQGFGEALLSALADLSLRNPPMECNTTRISLMAAASDDYAALEVAASEERSSTPHYNESDCLLSLQLLAYLSKYPHLRRRLRNDHDPLDVFGLVERFCARHHPAELQYWAGIVMRNGCRKDEPTSSGLALLVDDESSLRYCARIGCKKRESVPREFAKCRRCRRAKYCSKECQSRAWSDGHKYWCVERGTPPQPNAGAPAPTQPATEGTEMVHTSSSSALLPTEESLGLEMT